MKGHISSAVRNPALGPLVPPTQKFSSTAKRFVLILCLVQAAAAYAQAPPAAPQRYEATLDAMGSAFSVAVYGEDRDALASAVDAALDEARRLDHKLSNYRADSEWSQVNRLAATREVAVSPELFRLLEACVRYSAASDGAFDITVGPLMKVWGFYKGSGKLASKPEVANALGQVGYKGIALDPEKRTVRFAKLGMEIDPGGVGKGYAVDRMVDVLKEYGIRQAFITAGGSSMYALGAPPGEKGWKVIIRHPKDANRTVAEVILKDESMSTSGNYEKFFRADGKIYSHIMDPRTGFPSMGMYSVSVVTPLCLDSEVWAKPFYILGRQWAAQHTPRGFRVFLCEDKGDAVCAWLQ